MHVPMHILVAHPDPGLLELAKMELERQGVIAHPTLDLGEALHHLDFGTTDGAIVDLNLGHGDVSDVRLRPLLNWDGSWSSVSENGLLLGVALKQRGVRFTMINTSNNHSAEVANDRGWKVWSCDAADQYRDWFWNGRLKELSPAQLEKLLEQMSDK